jgi:L-ribulose-5-phosphate 4-epimerase
LKHEALCQSVCAANQMLHQHHLVIGSFGNVSGIDRREGVVAIKPSGVAYDQLTPESIVVHDLAGRQVAGALRPSSDTPTHLELYRAFPDLGGVCHTHSSYATMWAQAGREIPCFGTTHADYFYGSVPLTETLTPEEIAHDYEINTGRVIVRRFAHLTPREMPAVLVAGHGPFTWGRDAAQAVEMAVILEQIAATALGTLQLNPLQTPIPQPLLDKHFLRKHGPDAYYGQK